MKTIAIKDFRCYSEKTMEFRSGINLLIGDNSVGKTSLLRACNYVMNAFFAGYSQTYTKWECAGSRDFRIYSSSKGTLMRAERMVISFLPLASDFPTITKIDGTKISLDCKKSFRIEKKSSKNAKPLVAGLKKMKEYCADLAANAHFFDKVKQEVVQLNALPVYSYFSTEDIHSSGAKFDKSGFKIEDQLASFGYYRCSDSKGLFDCWINRLLVLQEADEDRTDIDNVRNAIVQALGPNGCNIISDISFKVNKKKMVFTQVDGRKVEHDYLSDGYRRVVNIVLDIAIRCSLLNKELYGVDAYKKTHGTVIIDEIDEHLHPELQVRILKALHDTFPKIQFIVSTHAPLVMSSVENTQENVVYKLEYKDGVYSHTELNTYGLDASTIMDIYMEQVPRDLFIDAEIKKIESLIDAERYLDARAALNKLLERPGSDANPDFARIEATLSFFED